MGGCTTTAILNVLRSFAKYSGSRVSRVEIYSVTIVSFMCFFLCVRGAPLSISSHSLFLLLKQSASRYRRTSVCKMGKKKKKKKLTKKKIYTKTSTHKSLGMCQKVQEKTICTFKRRYYRIVDKLFVLSPLWPSFGSRFFCFTPFSPIILQFCINE